MEKPSVGKMAVKEQYLAGLEGDLVSLARMPTLSGFTHIDFERASV